MPSAWHRVTAALLLLVVLLSTARTVVAAAVAHIRPPPELEAAVHEAVRLYRAAVTAEQDANAVQLFHDSISTYPLAHAFNNLGLLLFELGDHEALAVFLQGAQVAHHANENETLVAIESNIGFVLRSQNAKSVALCLEAIAHFDRALALDPLHVHALYNKASALYELREFDAAEALLIHVLALHPTHIGANMDLGGIFYARRDVERAVYYQDVVIANAETLAAKLGALANKGNFLRGAGQPVLALEAFEQAYALASGDSKAVFNVVIGRRPLCAWDRIEELHDELLGIVERVLSSSSSPTYTPLLPFDATLMKVSDAFRKRLAVVDSRQTDQTVTLELMTSNRLSGSSAQVSMRPKTPLKIGYLSYDFRDHPMGQLILGFIENHNQQLIETFCYSYGHNDGSEWRHRAEASCTVFRDIAGLSDLDAARHIALDQVDMVVDLMGHTTGARIGIPSLKPSRIVVNYLGYPGTTGSTSTDFVVVDKLVIPPERVRAAMTEQVVYLPATYQSNLHEREPQACLEIEPGLDTEASDFRRCPLATKAEHGLPEDQDETVVFCNFNTINKMEPVAFALWLRILHRVPRSVLWLLEPSSEDSIVIMTTLVKEAQAHGVHPSRVIFAPWETKKTHMARLTLADIFLDSLVYNAHSTASDALWANVPIVTLWGDTFPSRVAASLIQNALPEFSELTPHSLKEYEELAVQLALSPALLRRYRRELASHALKSPLFDSKHTTASLERSYELMHDLTHHVKTSQATKKRFQVVVTSEASSQRDANTNLRVQEAVGEGLRHQRLKDFQTAQYFYSLALQTDPNHADALHLLATLHFERGHARQAHKLLHRVIQDHPEVALYRMNAAVIAASLGEMGTAATEFQQVLRLEPSNTVAFRKLVEIHFEASDSKAVVDLFKAFGGPTLASSALTGGEASQVGDSEREHAFLRYSYALAMTNRESEAIELLQDAIAKHKTYYRVGYNLVVFFNRQGLYPLGEEWLVKVVLAEAQSSYESRGRGFRKRPRPKDTGRKVVAIYCHEYGQGWWGQWGPSSLETGLGGSEEAVVFLSAELQKLGYWVEVYGDPSEKDILTITPEMDGQEHFPNRSSSQERVVWYPHYAYDLEDTEVDIFVAWRYHGSLVVGRKARSRYLWMHDIPSADVRQSELLVSLSTSEGQMGSKNFVSGILCVSAFQASFFHSRVHELKLIILTTNGLDARHFMANDEDEPGRNHATNFVYGSAPNRGLEFVLRAWPQIRAAIPEAQLTVFYGFTQAFDRWGATEISEFAVWKFEMETLVNTLPGVHYAGLVGHEQLARGYAQAGFYLYPTTFSETSSVTLMKAMASGAIPITSRYSHSALQETCGGFDLGPAQALDDQDPSVEWLRLWVQSVVGAVQDDSGRVRALRGQMKAFARDKYTWVSVAKQWHEVFEAELA